MEGNVERWQGITGTSVVQRVTVPITDVSESGVSPYAKRSGQGATIVPRCLFFAEEVENPAIVQAGQTVTVNPRRGSFDKEPWRSLDLTGITGQTIETQHVFDVHLGETLLPYATLNPLKAVLPLKHEDGKLSGNPKGVGGVHLGALRPRMRERWRKVNPLWEGNKAEANALNLLEQLDYYGKLSAQLEWRQRSASRPLRVTYSSSGMPTAALLRNRDAIVDYTLFWIACEDDQEANYLLSIINSESLYGAVASLMPKGLFGARHLQKHLWNLPIPAFNPRNRVHTLVSRVGKATADGVAEQLTKLRQERGDVSVTIARRELRKWLRESKEGKAVEKAVSKLLMG